MKQVRPWLANTLWQTSNFPAWRHFLRASTRVKDVQDKLLANYLKTNQDTDYGRRFKFATIKSAEAYQSEVPLTSYDDYHGEIDAIGQGKQNVLTTSPVRLFEISSGSTGASNLIPYTDRLRAEFQQGIAGWMYDLFRHWPHLKDGSAYWSISPLVGGHRSTPGGIPIGFDDDTAYLGTLGKYLADSSLAVPNEVKHIPDVSSFRYATLLFLVHHANLRIISVWNPTFLSLLLAPLPRWWPGIIEDIAQGTLSPPTDLDSWLRQRLLEHLPPDPERAARLIRICPTDYQTLWPHLSLVSCWMDGPSARFAGDLQAQFPQVAFQGKGLIATEAFVSFPIMGVIGAALAVTTHFFEFLPVNKQTYQVSSSQPKLAHELDQGQAYAVVVTTGGGFYRYRLQDIVEAVDHLNQVPCLRFLGKANWISDWFGEKLNERFVASVLEKLFRSQGLRPAFALLAPDDAAQGFRYTLYLEIRSRPSSDNVLTRLAADLDLHLRQNFHYDYCRKLGQLAHPAVLVVGRGSTEAYLKARLSTGQRLGNIKPSCLEKTTGWGDYLSRPAGAEFH